MRPHDDQIQILRAKLTELESIVLSRFDPRQTHAPSTPQVAQASRLSVGALRALWRRWFGVVK